MGSAAGRPPNEQASETGAPLSRCSGAAPACREPAAQPERQGASCREGLLLAAILGFSTALITLVLDQVTKLYTLFVYDLPVKEPVRVRSASSTSSWSGTGAFPTACSSRIPSSGAGA